LTFTETYKSQSQNSTANIALCVDDFFQNYLETRTKERIQWIEIKEDSVLYTTYEVFQFWDYSFSFDMLSNIVNNLIPTGIMKHLIELHYTKKWKFDEEASEPKVFSIDDLLFGFKIWIGCCLTSLASFVLELASIYLKKSQKPVFIKVYPLLNSNNDSKCKLKLELVQKFRVQNHEAKVHIENINKQDGEE
jgi:hypothetical protein